MRPDALQWGFALIAVLVVSSARAQDDTLRVLIDGEPRDAAAVLALRDDVRKELAGLPTKPVGEDQTLDERRLILDDEIKSLEGVAEALTRVANRDALKRERTAEIEKARADLTSLRVEKQKPIEFATVSAEELERLDTETRTVGANATQAAATQAATQERAAARERAFVGLADEIEKATTALAENVQQRETEVDPTLQGLMAHRVRTREIRLRGLELDRDHHATLLELDRLRQEAAKAASQLAAERAAQAEAVLLAARTAHEREQGFRVLIDGGRRDAAAVLVLRDEVRKELAGLDTKPVGEDKALDERRQILDNEIKALEGVAEALTRITNRETLRRDRTTEIEKVRADLTTARVEKQKPIEFPTMSAEELERLETEARTATANGTQADAALAAAQERTAARERAFNGLADEIEKATAALAEIVRQREAEADATLAQALTHRVRTREARLRSLELDRDHHVTLLELDRMRQDLARIGSELAAERASRADAVVRAARTTREKTLAAEAVAEKAEAERKRRAAELAESPTEKAIQRLDALADDFSAAAKEDETRKSRLKRWAEDATVHVDRVTRRNGVIEKLFPVGADLDEWKVKALREEGEAFERERALITRWGSDVEDVDSLTRWAIGLRDQLETLRDLVKRTRDSAKDDSIWLMEDGLDPTQQRWLDIVRGYREGLPNLLERESESYHHRFVTETDRFLKTIEDRLTVVADVEPLAQKLDERKTALADALDYRQRYLDSISLWLRSPPPLGQDERAHAAEEFDELGSGLAVVPAAVIAFWERLDRPWGLAVFAAIYAALAILGGGGVRRRLRRSRVLAAPLADLDRLTRLLRLSASVLAGTAVIGPLFLGALALHTVFREERIPVALCWILGGAFFWRFVHALTGCLFDRDAQEQRFLVSDDATARTARRVLRLMSAAVAVLIPASFLLDSYGFTRLALLARLALAAWCLALGGWVAFRPDVLAPLIPTKSEAIFARAVRALAPIAWPLAIIFFLGVFVLLVMGYRNAAWYFTSRSLLCAATLAAGSLLYQLLYALVLHQLEPPAASEEAEEREEVSIKRRLARRFLGTLLYAATVTGTVVSLSVVFGVSRADWAEFGGRSLGNGDGLKISELARAVLVFGVVTLLAGYVRDLLEIFLATRTRKGSGYVIRTLAYYAMIAFATVLSLSTLGVQLDQLGWFLTAATVGIGFGLQEIISNFVAGLILFFERPVQVGDIITLGTVEGDVVRINIRSTVLRTRDGISIIIPNKKLITDDVINWSHGDPRTRLRLPVSVAYGSDVALVKRVLIEVAEREGRILARPRPEVDFDGFGESELKFNLLGWLARPDITVRRRVRSDLNSAIDAAFRRVGIEIPFPQRDLHVRTVPKKDVPDAEELESILSGDVPEP